MALLLSSASTLTFPLFPLPQITFTFSCPMRKPCRKISSASIASTISSASTASSLSRSRKRPRPQTLISRDSHMLPSRKKRRLRLLLITSPLSRPFSTPATYIADHGMGRVAVWAKAKNVGGRGLLRKAAILNRARLGGWSSPKIQAKKGCLMYGDTPNVDLDGFSICSPEKEEVRGEADTQNAPRRNPSWEPLPPSPLGLTNYDELDDWPGYIDGTEDDTGDTRSDDAVYSDFNFFDPEPEKTNDEDYDDPFAVLPTELLNTERPPSAPEEPFLKLIKEEERVGGLRFFTVP